MAFLTAAGTLRGIRRADVKTVSDLDPSLSVLTNGDVVVMWTDAFGGNNDIRYAVFNPQTMVRVWTAGFEIQAGNQTESSVTALANGIFVTAWSDANNTLTDGNTDPNGSHVSLQIYARVRTSFGDEANDIFVGDQLRDVFTSNGGNDRSIYVPGNGINSWTDFTPGIGTPDQIDLTALNLTLVGALALATQVGADTVFNFGGGDTLTLQNVLKSDLNGNDFIGLRPADRDFNADSKGDSSSSTTMARSASG